MRFTIWGYDIGGHTKALKFGGDDRGRLWFAHGFPADVPRVETPHDLPADRLMPTLQATLREHGLWNDDHLIGYSICGPVVGGTCLRLINRGVRDAFVIGGDAAGNDGMMATIGSLIAGVARGHPGGLACFTLGTGIGFGSLHWDERGQRVTNDGEVHFTIRDTNRSCNCHRTGCFEGAANEAALRQCLEDEAFHVPERGDVGHLLETLLSSQESSPERPKVERALERWHDRLAQGIANVFVLLNLGGNTFQPPAFFVLAGGLSTLADEGLLRELVLKEFAGDPFLGKNFQVKKEGVLGNRAGCAGAAAMALANHLGRPVTDIQFLDEPPTT